MNEVLVGGFLTLVGGFAGALLAEWLHARRMREYRSHEALERALDDTGRLITDALMAMVAYALNRQPRFTQMVDHLDSRSYQYADPTLLGNVELLSDIVQLIQTNLQAGLGNGMESVFEIGARVADVHQAVFSQRRRLLVERTSSTWSHR